MEESALVAKAEKYLKEISNDGKFNMFPILLNTIN